MPYTPSEWADGEAGGTPITAAALNKIEDGIADATDAAEAPLVADDVPALPASKVSSGTFADARIPALAIGKITGLQAALDGKQASGSYATASALSALDARVAALEAAASEPEA